MAQIVYYFWAALKLGAPERPVAFTVPTGNFGDIFAGYAARKMGLPVKRLVIATNLNDSLARALATGIYEPRGVIATSSPSMDIQLASNFERMLFELAGRNAAPTAPSTSTRRHQAQIVVVDNASTDGTEAFFREWAGGTPLRYHRNADNVGLIRALNQGARVIEVPIVFTDRVAGASKLSRRIVVAASIVVWAK